MSSTDDGSAAGDNAVLTLLRFLQSHNVSLDSLASTASAPAAERKGVEGGELAGLEALGRSGLLYVAMWHASVQDPSASSPQPSSAPTAAASAPVDSSTSQGHGGASQAGSLVLAQWALAAAGV
ncbi:hypothetical protein HaLaN_09469 [Haematococcus lacustris]|uniref:Uncharacterized protein n=1 Tax=Haematococcus lacustris TaxID=44745 RepID=A0A699YVH5_HAELA|nr:hypothetical protein HaLaN_09469 [Haematococcus lacustris]